MGIEFWRDPPLKVLGDTEIELFDENQLVLSERGDLKLEKPRGKVSL
jgi:hypothetical protein